MPDKCPTCESPDRAKHPAMQHEGEVQPCRDPWHGGVNPEPGSNTRLQKWVDPAMFVSEKLRAERGPRVFLLNATPDPLGAVAAMCKMYEGKVVRDLRDGVNDRDRRHYLAEMQKTKLTTPLESVQLHFMIEGVTRSFTHQMVRQRTAAYAQESMRFAVVEDSFAERTAPPPSLAGTKETTIPYMFNVGASGDRGQYPGYDRLTYEEKMRVVWDSALDTIQEAYNTLVAKGMPAEDARGLLPHNMTTRLHYVTNLRGLLDHAGNRLCTQAQFEWRLVLSQLAGALRNYSTCEGHEYDYESADCYRCDNWQFAAISDLLRPVCYQIGKCAFAAEFDRKCSIRNRVQANADLNRPSLYWDEEFDEVSGDEVVSGISPQSVLRDGPTARPVFIGAIRPAEWLLDPGAAR